MSSILLLSKYGPPGASSRQRCLQFLPALERRGHAVTVRPFFDDDYLRRLYAGRRPDPGAVLAAYARRLAAMRGARPYDVVWLEKEFLPWLPHGLEAAAFAGTPYVVDFDDAWYLRYQTDRRAAVRRVLGAKFDGIVRNAACVVAGNAVLADWAAGRGARRVERIPTVVDCARYPLRPMPEGPFTVAWIGTPVTAGYLDLVREALTRLAADGPVRLRVVGAAGVAVEGVEVESLPWSEDTEAEALAGAHAGIMPLPDGPWERGKCGYKLIQYMAAGRPVVASPVGANTAIVRPGRTGFLAASPAEWTEALDHLRRDPAECARMGAEARQVAEAEYSLAAQADHVAAVLESAAGR